MSFEGGLFRSASCRRYFAEELIGFLRVKLHLYCLSISVSILYHSAQDFKHPFEHLETPVLYVEHCICTW